MIVNLTESIRREIGRNDIQKVFQLVFILRGKLQKSGYFEYSNRLTNLDNQYRNEEENLNKGLLSQEDHETSRNKIIWSLIQLLNEIESDPEIKSQIEINIALAQTEEAIQRLVHLTKGTKIHKEALLLSSRFYNLKKDSEQGKEPSLINKFLKSIIERIGNVYKKFT